MAHVSDQEAQRVYLDSLRWRKHALQTKIEEIGQKIATLTRDDSELKQQLRAVEQLLSAEGEAPADLRRPDVAGPPASALPADGNGQAPHAEDVSLSFVRWGPKSRAIYTAAAEVIREAGVPLHYRVLAEEVQKHVALGGNDPGATLIAHLHRAQDTFPRVGRGIYGLQGMVVQGDSNEPAQPQPEKRRRKTRRRTR